MVEAGATTTFFLAGATTTFFLAGETTGALAAGAGAATGASAANTEKLNNDITAINSDFMIYLVLKLESGRLFCY